MQLDQWIKTVSHLAGLVFAALLLTVTPSLVWPVGVVFGLWFCWWVSPMRETVIVKRQTWRIDSEHERL